MIERLSTVLPDPDSPTMPTASASFDGERHPVDSPHQPAGGAEVRHEVGDVEQRSPPSIRSPPA